MIIHNNLIHLLTGDRRLPAGWGFPPHTDRQMPPAPLRNLLLFLDDDDGHAQLVRWYFSIIRAYTPAWKALVQQTEGYVPSMFWRAAVESPSLTFVRDPEIGALIGARTVGPDVRNLTGKILVGTGAVLELDGKSYPLTYGPDDQVLRVQWPEILQLTAGLESMPEGEHLVHFRARRFDAAAIVSLVLEHGLPELERCGLLAPFLSVPQPVDKLAIAWMAVDRLEPSAG